MGVADCARKCCVEHLKAGRFTPRLRGRGAEASRARGEFSGYTILFNVAFTMVLGPLIGGWLIHAFGERRLINGEEAIIPAPVIF